MMARVLAVALLVVCGSARADDARDLAKIHAEAAKLEFARGRYREAKREFEQAYDLAPLPPLLYNIGRCQEKLGEAAGAARSYERFLAAEPDTEDRAALTELIAKLKAQAQQAVVSSAVSPPPIVVAPAPPRPKPL